MNFRTSWLKSASKLFVILIFILLVCVSCTSTNDKIVVTRVIDGDTVEITGGDRVRYIGIDTPERDEYYYAEATEKNAELVEGREVRLEKDVSEKDQYGRLLRYIYVGDLFVNAELVRLGYARAYPYPPDTNYADLFSQLELEAKQAGRGMWAK